MNKKLKLAEEFMKEAYQQLEEYKKTKKELRLRQACENGWAVVMSALKVVNPKIKYHSW